MLTKYFLFDCSVIGLNFDFLALNIVGFTLYGCYNVAMFWIDSIQVLKSSKSLKVQLTALILKDLTNDDTIHDQPLATV